MTAVGSIVVPPAPSAIAARQLVATTSHWSVEVVADWLDYPLDIEHADGRIYLTEAAGNVVSVGDGRVLRHRLETSDAIARVGGGGLLWIAFSKDFVASRTAYFYHTYNRGSGPMNKVIEAKRRGDS